MQANKFLCVPAFEEIGELITSKRDNVSGVFLSEEELHSTENTEVKLVTYTTIFAVDVDNGKLMFIQAKRLPEEIKEGAEKANTMTTIGIDSVVTEESEVVCSETVQEEDGSVSYTMNLKNLIDTGVNSAMTSFVKTTSVNLAEMDVDVNKAESAFFTGSPDDEKSYKSLGFSMQIQVTPEKFEEIKNACVLDSTQYSALDVLGVNLDVIVEEMDISVTVGNISKDLKANHSLEDWSTRIFEYATRKTIASILNFVTYKDLIEVAKFRAIEAQKEKEEKDTTEKDQAASV